jgi:hypothetical protein
VSEVRKIENKQRKDAVMGRRRRFTKLRGRSSGGKCRGWKSGFGGGNGEKK